MTQVDLFGNAIEEKTLPVAEGVPKKRKPTLPKGYAGIPGTGPAGETCKTCQHIVRRGGCSRRYLKCGLNCRNWTNGPGSDIKAGSPACKFWKEKE